MLPLLRVLPLGSLFLSALIFLLAATPPRRPALPDALGPARGPLIDAAEHPEWRQFYVQAAFKRADEIEHLRDLPNTPTRMPVIALPEAQKAALQPAAKEIVAAVTPAAPAPEESRDAPVFPAKEITPAQQVLPSADVDAPVVPAVVAETAGPPLPLVRTQQMAAIQPAPAKEIVVPVASAAPAPEQDAPAIPAKEITPAQQVPPSADVDAPVVPAVVAETAGPPLPLERPQQMAGLPSEPETAGSDDITGAPDNPAIAATMPIEIGERSSAELLLVMPPERPTLLPVSRPKAGARAKMPHTAKRPVRAAKRPAARAAKQQAQPTAQTNSFHSLFGER